MKAIQIKKSYDKFSKDYDRFALSDKYRAFVKLDKIGLKYFHHKNARVLDLGCGTGLSSVEFFKRDFEVTGIDISQGMLDEAKKYSFKKLICQDLEKPLKVDDNYFDIVTLTGVMEFIKNPLKLFLEIKKKLKNKGLFLLSVPEKYPEGSYLREKLGRKSYLPNEIEKEFNKAGLKILKRKKIFGYYRKIEGKREKSYFYLYVLRKS